jgi:thymidylate synthase (FAD)
MQGTTPFNNLLGGLIMRLIKPSFKIEGNYMADPLAMESIGRICYKSEDKITEGSAEKFIKARLNNHESVIEHSTLTVRFICDRGVSHELVRHRLASFSQESTRYCNYKGGVTFIIPPWVDCVEGKYKDISSMHTMHITTYLWLLSMHRAELEYTDLLTTGWTPQQARSVLPNSTKTEIVMTANFREWRHIFKLRCDKAAHPQMRELMIPLLEECKRIIPIIFYDITY